MKASSADQKTLLTLQGIDTGVQRAAYRAGHLPEETRIAELQKEVETVRLKHIERVGVREDARTELGRLESDVTTVEARIKRDTDRIQTSTSVKDVEALQSELASLQKRQNDLEEIELTVMQRVEDAEAGVAEAESERKGLQELLDEVIAKRDVQLVELRAEQERLEADRASIVPGIPAELFALYEQRRTRGGTGAALFRAGTCGACNMTLNGNDLATVRSAGDDDVVQCPECSAILVRTNESGL
ncbi:zinc ribbon domain-containing protein [Plantibacter sp. YIM 135249]|uniref:zinc ribbon domain-containing protein n=1 Tax=Plantibacter sp. YIM 135249 TaxID=3423918 RepID=UPI003D32BE4B